ncbi:MAG: VCBS repeat-containing protein [Planctomycetota bacterium]
MQQGTLRRADNTPSLWLSSLWPWSCLVAFAGTGCSDNDSAPAAQRFARVAFETRAERPVVSTLDADVRLAPLALGDLDGDGRLDLVTAGTGDASRGGTLEVLGGDGSSQFTPRQSLPIDWSATRLRLQDLDADGSLDVIALAVGTGTVHVFLGDGQGNLLPQGWRLAAGAVADIAIADVIGAAAGSAADGIPDLLLAGGARLRVHAGAGDGTFAPTAASPNPLMLPASGGIAPRLVALETANLDSGALAEVIALDAAGARAVVFRAAPGTMGAVWEIITLPGGVTDPSTVALGDLDGDGRTDLALAGGGDPAVMLLRRLPNPGTLAFEPRAMSADRPIARVHIADVDRDGRGDLITSSPARAAVDVYLRPWSATPPAKRALPATGSPFAIRSGDLDRDGRLDLVVTGSGTNVLSVYRGNATGRMVAAHEHATGHPGPEGVAATDLLRNGRAELALVGRTSRDVVLFGIGAGAPPDLFGARPLGTIDVGAPAYGIDAFDLDANDAPDLLVRTTQGLRVLMHGGRAPGQAAPEFRAVPAAPARFAAEGIAVLRVAVADLDADGWPDLVGTDPRGNALVVLRSRSAQSFESTTVPLEARPAGVAAGDFDGDGAIDVAVAMMQASRVELLRGDGDGGLTPGWLLEPVAAGPNELRAADIDGDRLPDLVVTNTLGNAITVLRNASGLGGPAFAVSTLDAGAAPTELVVQDLDRDGNPDLLASSLQGQWTRVWRGDGAGGFAAQPAFPAPLAPSGLTLGDIDGDGRRDLIHASRGATGVSIARNVSPEAEP